ncbi:hypothetical protein EIQ06_01100 [Xanthomonas campestris pv. campestris]|uniref:Exported protein n=1 Tax=Xanthomonas campestris pv. campestris (strain B100) TaxID=509169 RepID=B0RXM8_XANCB|nr:hypothetical protein [Xanthomonas campestris]MDO0844184.1 hypothetical protein [Xanthomonas campestris pv. campestris]MEA0622576.1 hypothetical protein [Xanthomonas campestris pv. campestris]MEA0626794.1 hypothetical protein [Xanthomonas campestris pv. campestris]MEA0647304.1 hypothetical protein [Xanthomonas campestris pv. campestris]MEA0667729.1 hypothetical protein [Xanthomonas campestris pv. campestris]
MMRRVAALLLWGLIGTAQATEQIPDRIQIDGRDAALLAEPLSAVLDDQATWQRFVAHVRQALGGCSANWRGYQAYWRLDGASLLLDRMVIGACADTPPNLPLQVLFPQRQAPLLADWGDGELLIALPDAYAHSVAAAPAQASSKSLPYLLLHVQHGQITAREPLSAAMLEARHAAADAQRAAPHP